MPHTADQARARQVELILAQVPSLPTLSHVAARLLTLASDDETGLSEIGRLIETDPALATRILGLCRRANRGLSSKINTVRRAVAMLGLEAVRSCVLSVSVYDLMQQTQSRTEARPEQARLDRALGSTGEGRAFDRVGFWKHSIAVGCVSELLAQELPGSRGVPEEAFLAGLVHDLGKLVLELILPRSYERVLALAERRQCDSAPVERSVLGLDHHTAGARIAQHWMLPESLHDVLWFHSQPATLVPDSAHRQLVGLVTLAKAVCRALALGWSGDFGPAPDPAPLCTQIGIDPAVIATLTDPLNKIMAERCELLGLDIETGPAVLLAAVSSANRQLARLNAALQERSRLAGHQARVLQAIRSFQSVASPGKGLVDTLADVAASAGALLGQGFYALLFQSGSGSQGRAADEPWQLFQFIRAGGMDAPAEEGLRHEHVTAHDFVVRSQTIEPPPAREPGARSLAALTDPCQLSLGAVGLLPWLSDYLNDAQDIRRVRLLPLTSGARDAGGPAAVLLHDREIADILPSEILLGAITSTWAGAVHGAARYEEAQHFNQRLAEVSRSLAEAQNRLTEAESLARLGEMTAGAAHEMNNPLTIISGRSQLLACRLTDLKDRAAATAIAEAADDLSDLISSLNLIAEPPRPRPQATQAGRLVADAIEMTRQRLGTDPPIRTRIASDLPVCFLDRELLCRALCELIVNAVEAAPDTEVEVRVHADDLDGRLIFTVTDRGPGLSPRALHHAFDAFFSEKPAGRQRGLGLTRARRLVQACDGSINLAQAQGHGTIASIELDSWRPPADIISSTRRPAAA